MQRIDSPRIGVDQGDIEIFSEFEEGGAMWSGDGPRERRRHVRFAQSVDARNALGAEPAAPRSPTMRAMRSPPDASETTATHSATLTTPAARKCRAIAPSRDDVHSNRDGGHRAGDAVF